MKYIIIEADTNNGDYVTECSLINDNEIELLKPIVEAIKNIDNDNWETGECCCEHDPYGLYVETKILTEEQVDWFQQFVPYGEYGIHTIESILIMEFIEKLL